MLSILSAPNLRIKKLYESSNYNDIIKEFEQIKNNLTLFSIHEKLALQFYYLESLLKSKNMQTILQITKSIQNEFSIVELEPIDKLIYYCILLNGFGNTGNFEEESNWYKISSEFVKSNKNDLINSKDIFWYYYYNNLSAQIETRQKNFSIAYDILKQNDKHFSNIKVKTTSDNIMLASTNLLLGQLHKQMNYLEMASNNFRKAVHCGVQANNIEYTRLSYLNLILTYEEQGKEYLTVQTSNDLIDLIKEKFNSDEFSLSSALNLLGNLYNRMGEFELAKTYYLQAFAILTDNNLIQKIRSFNHNNMGVISFKLGDFMEALNYFNLALELAIEKQDPRELAFYYSNIGETYLELNEFEKAMENELHSITFLNVLKNDDLLVETYLIIVRISLEQKDFNKADYYINEIYNLWLKTKRKIFEQKYKLAKAIKLKKELKFEESKEIFLSVLADPVIAYDLEILTLTELEGMLLYAIVKFKDSNFKDLELISQKLMQLGKEKNTIPVICNLSILLSRIHMISSQFDAAENVLQEALDICNIKNVEYFKKKIQDEFQFCSEVRKIVMVNPEKGKGLLAQSLGSTELVKRIRDLQRLMISDQ